VFRKVYVIALRREAADREEGDRPSRGARFPDLDVALVTPHAGRTHTGFVIAEGEVTKPLQSESSHSTMPPVI
jgi:hypothetical protein